MLRAPEIQTIIKREGDDTPDQMEETYFFFVKWIHGVANDSEYTQTTMRRCQRYANTRAQAQFLSPWLESRIPFFYVPIGSMLWFVAGHCMPRWRIFHRQIGHGKRSLTPGKRSEERRVGKECRSRWSQSE